MDYRGKTLTIAQSTPEWSETSRIEATPASVVLYCGYAYESGIIAESYSTAIVAAVLFAVGVALAAAFWRTKDWKLLCIAMTAFLSMCFLLVNTSFFEKYFTGYVDAHWYVRCAAAVFLLLFLTLKAGKFRKFMWGVSIPCVLSVPVSLAITATVPDSIDFFTNFLQHGLPEYLLFIGFVASMVLGMVCWRKQSRFYRLYAPLTLIVMVVYWTTALIFDANLSNTLPVGLLSGHITQIYYRVFDICMVTALFAAVVEAVQNELRRRTEKQLLEQSREMAQVTYENMRRQHEEVMKLRHDMLGHLQAVKALSGEEKVQSYLDELIGKNERVRPLIRTGNTMLNIILNARLTAAVDAGIKTEILRLNVPEKLMLSDADLCSLIMNMMNNAITAASQSGADEPYIKLDIHVKDRWLAIVCQNTADTRRAPKKRTEEGVPRHGFGLKIMEEIAQRYNGLFDTECGADYYKVNVILPLD